MTDLESLDLKRVFHPNTNLATHHKSGPFIITRGEGIHVWDNHGNKYIEGMAGLWCTALGYGDEELAKTAYEQIKKLSFTHLFAGKSHEPGILLADKLVGMAPFAASKVFFGNSGSDANDTQVKLVWYYHNAIGKPKKKKIISRQKAYHGVTVATAGLTGLPSFHKNFDEPLAFVRHTDCPYYYRNAEPGESEDDYATRLADNLEKLILAEDPETIGAFIAEPLMGVGGVLLPPMTYFPKVQKVLAKYEILLIDDEVICGFGRTGNTWGAQTFGMKPTTLTAAKGLSSAYLPISAVIVPEFLYEPMIETSAQVGLFGHGFTYSGHPVAAAVALRTLAIYEERKLYDHVRRMTPRFQQRLHGLADHPLVGEARGVGLVGACELVKNKETKQAFDAKLAARVRSAWRLAKTAAS
jgi:4-aminobutyrate--pyruvate transaminase